MITEKAIFVYVVRRRINKTKNRGIRQSVGINKRDLKWRVRVIHNKKDIELGKFDNEISAALAYNEAAEKYHKEFAWLNRNNFVEVEEEYKRRRM